MSLSLLGPLLAENIDGPVPLRYNKARALLAYLAVEPGFHTREALACLLWPDAGSQSGREKLRRMLFMLRDALRGHAPLIESTREVVRLQGGSRLWIDVREFTDILDRNLRGKVLGASMDAACLAHAVALYRGEFLQGLELDDAPDFGNWLQFQREQFDQKYRMALGALVESYEHEGDLHAAIASALQWTAAAPLDEGAWRQLLRILLKAGQRERAQQELQRYAHLLDLELGVPPAPSITAMFDTEQPRGTEIRLPLLGERRQLTILSCEFEASGEPEDIAEVLLELCECCEPALRAAGAHLMRTPGGVVAYFGYPIAQEDATRRAFVAALSCHAALSARLAQRPEPPDVRLRFGLHTGIGIASIRDGLADAGGVLSRQAFQVGAMGEGVLVSENALRVMGGNFPAERVGQIFDSGNDARISVYLVRGEREPSVRDAELFRGREPELAVLRAAYERGRSCLVRGEAGIGKSSLVEHFCATQGVRRIVLQCAPEWKSTPFHPFVAWARIACAEARAGESERGSAARDWLDDLASRLLLNGANVPSGGSSKEDVGSLLRELLAERVPEGWAIYVDDAHWADPATRDMLALLAEQPLAGRMLIVTARNEFTPPWKPATGIDVIDMPALDDAAMQELIRGLARDAEIDADAQEDILRRSEGVPLYAVELTREALSGIAPLSGRLLPRRLNDLLMARIDSAGRAKCVAQFASVIGPAFSVEWVARAMGLPRAEIAEACMALLRQDIIVQCQGKNGPDARSFGPSLLPEEALFALGRPGGKNTYAFRHALLREAAYQSLNRAARIDAHVRMAQLLEHEGGDDWPEMLARHYTATGMRGPAIKYALAAARKAVGRCAYREAVGYYGSALEWFGPLGSRSGDAAELMEELGIRVELGVQLCALHGYGSEQAADMFRSAMTLAEPLGDDPCLFPVYWGMWNTSMCWAAFPVSVELADKLMRLGEASGDPNLLAHACHVRGYSYFFEGRFAEAAALLERGAGVYQSGRATLTLGEDARVTNLSILALCRWYQGRFVDAREAVEQAIAHAREVGHRYSLLYAMSVSIELYRLGRDIDAVARLAEELLDAAREIDAPYWRICAEVSGAWARAVRGETGALFAIAEHVRAMPGIMKGVMPFMIGVWADACDLAGEFAPGVQAVDLGLKEVAETQARCVQSEFERLRGKLMFRQGKPTGTCGFWLVQAVATARTTDSPFLLLRALVGLLKVAPPAPGAEEWGLLAEALERLQGGEGLREVRLAQALLSEHRAFVRHLVR